MFSSPEQKETNAEILRFNTYYNYLFDNFYGACQECPICITDFPLSELVYIDQHVADFPNLPEPVCAASCIGGLKNKNPFLHGTAFTHDHIRKDYDLYRYKVAVHKRFGVRLSDSQLKTIKSNFEEYKAQESIAPPVKLPPKPKPKPYRKASRAFCVLTIINTTSAALSPLYAGFLNNIIPVSLTALKYAALKGIVLGLLSSSIVGLLAVAVVGIIAYCLHCRSRTVKFADTRPPAENPNRSFTIRPARPTKHGYAQVPSAQVSTIHTSIEPSAPPGL